MPIFITHSTDSSIIGTQSHSSFNSLDKGNSEVFTSSLFVHTNSEGDNIAVAKETDDKIIIGYTPEGMAFQIVVDGFYGCDKNAVFSFIDEHVLSLMETYSTNLSNATDVSEITKNLIISIYALRKIYAPSAEFTMSLCITYKKDENLFCAGFGIGDTGIVIRRLTGSIEPLVYHTEVDGFKDAFDNHFYTDPNTVIERNSIFNTSVSEGDELLSYTYLPPSLEHTVKSSGLNKSLTLNPDFFDVHIPLFTQLLEQVEREQKNLIQAAKDKKEAQRFGDDFAVGKLIIPTKALIKEIQIHALSIQISEHLQTQIKSKTTKIDFFATFGFYKTQMKNIKDAILLNTLIKQYKEAPLALLVIFSLVPNLTPEIQTKIEALLIKEPLEHTQIEELHEKINASLENPNAVPPDLNVSLLGSNESVERVFEH